VNFVKRTSETETERETKMSNEVARREVSDVSPWKEFASESQANAIAGDLLRFSKGKFIAGEEKRVVPMGTPFVANMPELWTGWQRWWNGNIVEHRISRVIDRQPRILRDELGHTDETLWEIGPDGNPTDPWQPTQRLVMREAKGKRLVTFATSSWGGRTCLGKLCQDYDADRNEHPGAMPVVQLGLFMHRHKQFGEIAQPRLDIVGWTNWDGSEAAGPRAIAADVDDPRTMVNEVNPPPHDGEGIEW
jgi:hypothetical protein